MSSSEADDGGGGGAMEESRRPYINTGTSLFSDHDEINVTNCWRECLWFFEDFQPIHFKVVIALWMMCGYLEGEGVGSIDAAYTKGFDILFDLVQKHKILEFSDCHPRILRLARSAEAAAGNANCKHVGSCRNIKPTWSFLYALPKWRKITKVVISEDEMLNPNEHKGSAYFAASNPTPDSLRALLQNANNHFLLLLRGLPESSLPSDRFFLERRKTLRVLEISGSTRLTTIPLHTISQLSQLESLNLSGLPIEELPGSFFHHLTQLRWLILRGCCKLLSLDLTYAGRKVLNNLDVSHCTSLQNVVLHSKHFFELDLSYTSLDPLKLIPSILSVGDLYLRGSKLEYLSSIPMSDRVQVLDLSGSCCFTKLDDDLFNKMLKLLKLDLSWTKVKHLPSFANHNYLRVLSLRGLELESLETLSSLPNQLIELNLTALHIKSSPEFFKLDFLESLKHLQFLNLSQTFVAKLPDLSKLVALKELLLANCQCLNVVPDLQALSKLETLDLSLPNDSSSSHNCQLHFETKAHLLSSFPLPTSIKKLILTNRSGVQKLFRLITFDSLNLEILDLRGTDIIDWESKLEPQQSPQETIPKPTEIHVLFANDESNCKQSVLPSSSNDVGKVFKLLISNIQKNLNSDMTQEQVEMLHGDLKYIQENYVKLKNSSNWKSGKELFQELMDAATNLSTADFALDFADIKQLLRNVVKLKLLVPRRQMEEPEAFKVIKQKKKKPLFKRSRSQSQNQNQEDDVITNIVRGMERMKPNLLNSYECLTSTQKNCLLCFSIFPYNEDRDKNTDVLKSVMIKKKILIYWWVGEGFIDLQNPDPNPHTTSNPNQEVMTSREIEAERDVSKGVKKPKTAEEIGTQILKVLVEKGFIKHVMKKGRESGSCCIHPFVLSFVIEQAKKEGFFDFDQNSSKLTPYFTRSKRACLLNPHASVPSSCQLWANYCISPNMLKRFEIVKTLFNVNESMIDVKREWFSKMKNLYVLHLGIWGYENTDLIEVNDQKFLEDLKKMRQLRVLSLQGMPTIMKLPDSICHLKNLIILDLKDCSYLEELPVDIGSLECLTHLDISSCPLLYKLPIGISLLSNLEVLRGFVTSEQHATYVTSRCGMFSRQKNKVCTFSDLLKLERLRELSIIVNIFNFPEDGDLKVFREMKKLCKLKILWQRSISNEDSTTANRQETSTRLDRWLDKLTFWKHQPCQDVDKEDDREESKPLESIEKLEMWCFPYENAPRWLDPIKLKSLKKLYIVGGNLRKIPGSGTDESRWNVETLRLKHLHNLDIEWPELKIMFPKLMYMETIECGWHEFFPCDSEGVWRAGS